MASFLNVSTVSALVNGANGTKGDNVNNVISTVKVVVGTKYSDETGKPSPLFASFRLPGSHTTIDAVLAKLREMSRSPFKLTLPKTENISGKLEMTITLRTEYNGNGLADTLERLENAGRTRAEVIAAREEAERIAACSATETANEPTGTETASETTDPVPSKGRKGRKATDA